MFERFTDRARRVLVLAQEESRRLGSDSIGDEHLLLAMIDDPQSSSVRALTVLGVSVEDVRRALDEMIPKSEPRAFGHIPFTSAAKKAFEHALQESVQMGHGYVGSYHLLLGLLRVQRTAAKALYPLGVTLEATRSVAAEALAGGDGDDAEASGAPRVVTRVTATARAEGGWSGFAASDEPLCGTCRAPLAFTARYTVAEVAEADGDGRRRVRFVFCRGCGTTIGQQIISEE